MALFAAIAPIHAQQDDEVMAPMQEETVDETEILGGIQRDEYDSLLNAFYEERVYVRTVEECIPTKENPYFPPEVYKERMENIRSVIPMDYNPVVQQFIDKYSGRMRRSVAAMLGAGNFYFPVFEQALEANQVPIELKYLPVIESGLRPTVVSPAAAAGLWQFIPMAAKAFGLEINSLIDERLDLEKASYAAAAMLKKSYDIYGDWLLAIASYNCGVGGVNKAIKRSGGEKNFWKVRPFLPRETQNYVPAFLSVCYIMNYYCEHGICPLETQLPAASDTVMVSKNVTVSQIINATGIPRDLFKQLNPQYRTERIPGTPNNQCTLRLPNKYLNRLLERESLYRYGARAVRKPAEEKKDDEPVQQTPVSTEQQVEVSM